MGMRIIITVITSNRNNKKGRARQGREPNFCELVASQGYRIRP